MKVLAIDDEKFNRQILTDLLKDDYEVVLAKNALQGLEKARAHLPDLILLDVVMPGMDGYEALKILKSDETTRDISVIIISGLDTPIDEAKGLTMGALDYIAKPFHPAIVKSRVRNILDLVRHRKAIERMAVVDSLTGIHNRRQFDNALGVEWRKAARNRSQLALAMVDIDFFKQYNDNYGHTIGDDVLRNVAQTIVSCLKRPHDFCARYGGEEFAILLSETDTEGCRHVADTVRSAVEGLAISHEFSNAADVVTVSIGCAQTVPEDGDDNPRRLIQAADRMLYDAKRNGRNRVIWENSD